MRQCKYCKLDVAEDHEYRKLAAHHANCRLNPKYASRIEDVKRKKTLPRLDFTVLCIRCCSPYVITTTQKNFDKGRYRKHCTQSCANGHDMSSETKSKIRAAIVAKVGVESFDQVCQHCMRTFKTKRRAQKYCSRDCVRLHSFHPSDETKRMIRESMERCIAEGRHEGWKSRLTPSFAEAYVQGILDQYSIAYQTEYPVGRYSLDFADPERKIDFEVDGRQHLSRHEHDGKRDEYLTKLGWKVVRYAWTKPTTESRMNLESLIRSTFNICV